MEQPKYTCKHCGKPTNNFDAYGVFLAELTGERGVSYCDECSNHFQKVYEWENEQYKKGYLTCPWCGYEERDSWEIPDEDGDYECPACGNVFEYERVVEITYTSQKRLKDYPGDDAV